MGFLDNLRQSQKNNLHPNWKNLNSEKQLMEVIKGSFERPVMLFKHSTTCGISAGAKNRLETKWDISKMEKRSLILLIMQLIHKQCMMLWLSCKLKILFSKD